MLAAFKAYAASGQAELHTATITGDHAPGMYTYTPSAKIAEDLSMGRLTSSGPLENPADGVVLMLRTHPEPLNSTPNGGQSDFVWLSARTMHSHGAYVW